MTLLAVRDLRKEYPVRGALAGRRRAARHVAVEDVSFAINRGETVGLIGESGSGKSTIGRCILRLTEPTSGSIEFDGADLASISGRRLREVRRNLQIVFQNPEGSLDPRRSVGASIGEPLRAHKIGTRASQRARVHQLLEQVGLDRAVAGYRPQEFSGGERQRIGIARALAVEPALIVCDEPASALDVSVQAQILNLLRDLQDEHGLAYLFISHDIATVRVMCDEVIVLKDGRIVESGTTASVLGSPVDAYTEALVAAASA
ncbi:MAG TPA: ATP-binding cassette domain-containing protein [Microbacteriaceae bacterium]|jgi:peptide/nickel transport system ATP-binding protein/oligopeptide transport system ATP-binding protein|nr:ATP-binding cassette domain-containing protein [Microbacteriaceae bacterium]